MNSLRLDKNFNLVIENNSFVPIEGREAIAQHVGVRYSIFLGEFRWDTSAGVPYYQDVLIKNPSFPVLLGVLKAACLDTPGITNLLQFDFSLNDSTRQADLTLKAESTEGIVDFTQIIEIGGKTQ